MKIKKLTIITGILLLIAALGCGIGRNARDETSTPAAPTISYPNGAGLGFTWPETIPPDIPVLQGNISLVMASPGSHIRIFYQNLPRPQFMRYLDQLEKEGFELEYIVYTREGFPDDSDERTRRGEFDAVDITKGEYHMRLEYGSDTTTYDIYTTGF